MCIPSASCYFLHSTVDTVLLLLWLLLLLYFDLLLFFLVILLRKSFNSLTPVSECADFSFSIAKENQKLRANLNK